MSNCKKTSIGGQALIEGIMMRGPQVTAMGVRSPSGEIVVEEWPTNKDGHRPWYKKTCFVRGIFNMVETLMLGFKCLMRSADLAGMEEEEPSRFEKWLAVKTGKDLSGIVGSCALILGVALAVLLFIVIPTFLSSLLRPFVQARVALAAIEGGLKILIFILYLWLTSRIPDMRRVYGYHGAEHKTIACYEAGEPLTVENIRGYTRFHPRCGTSFLFLVLLVSILLSSVITWNNFLIRMLLKLLMLPIVVGVSYELIKLAGRCDNLFTRIISAPGLWLQRLTTNEPTDDQIEVAILAMTRVIPADNSDLW